MRDDTPRSISETIAGLMGPVLIAIAASLLLNRKNLPEMTVQIGNDWALVLISGVLMFVAGLAIVRVHNIWEANWRGLVTVLGWLSFAGGLMRIMYPRQLAAMAPSIVENPARLVIPMFLMLCLGVYLTLKGYRLLD
jgi:hypothetical protein